MKYGALSIDSSFTTRASNLPLLLELMMKMTKKILPWQLLLQTDQLCGWIGKAFANRSAVWIDR